MSEFLSDIHEAIYVLNAMLYVSGHNVRGVFKDGAISWMWPAR